MGLLHVVTLISFASASGYEYSINYERMELADYEKSLVKDAYFLFRKYNRTNFCLNTSFTLLQDIDGNDLDFTSSIYQRLSNTYKPTGLEMSFNVCKYWKLNMHNFREFIRNYSNLEGCDIKKGHYYVYNFMPDERNFPKYVPLGEYMYQVEVFWKKVKTLLKFQWIVEAKFKLTSG